MTTEAMTFECQGDTLLGLLHGVDAQTDRAAVIVVGGPQYRVGSHRQFLILAQGLADAGVPTLRFDYRGMGDSDGELRGFEHVDDDIRCAIDALCTRAPGVREVVLIGLCDAASAALMYAPLDARVTHVVIMNPWVRTEQSHARATVKHYYLQRLFSRDMWRKVFGGGFDFRGSLRSLVDTVAQLRGTQQPAATVRPFRERMLEGAQKFRGQILLVASGDDMTAAEFKDHVSATPQWQEVLADVRATTCEMPAANHTFACDAWRNEVTQHIVQWLSRNR